jgi:hypothetical protein
MKRFLLFSPIAISLLALLPKTPAQSQATRPKPGSPELQLTMDLDRQATGLEQVFKTQTDRAPGKSCPGRPSGEKITKEVWVNFQLAREGKRSTLFEHKIGNNLATYWVHHISEVRHFNRDGNVDLVFYQGDDTSDETVLLLMKGDHVKAVYAGVQELSREYRPDMVGSIIQNGKFLSRWDPDREVFVGDGIAWTVGSCIPLRKTPDAKGEIIRSLSENEVVQLVSKQGNWQKVNWGGGDEGWIESRQLANVSPTKTFPLK